MVMVEAPKWMPRVDSSSFFNPRGIARQRASDMAYPDEVTWEEETNADDEDRLIREALTCFFLSLTHTPDRCAHRQTDRQDEEELME